MEHKPWSCHWMKRLTLKILLSKVGNRLLGHLGKTENDVKAGRDFMGLFTISCVTFLLDLSFRSWLGSTAIHVRYVGICQDVYWRWWSGWWSWSSQGCLIESSSTWSIYVRPSDIPYQYTGHWQNSENIHLQPYTTEDDFYERIYPKYLALLDKARAFMFETNATPEKTIVLIR